MGSPWDRLALSPMTGALVKEGRGRLETQTEEKPCEDRTEAGVMGPQAKDARSRALVIPMGEPCERVQGAWHGQ